MAWDTDEVVRWYGNAASFHPAALEAVNDARLAQAHLDLALRYYDYCLGGY